MKSTKKATFLFIITGILYIIYAAVNVSLAFGLQRAIDYAGAGNLTGLLTTLALLMFVACPLLFLTLTLGNRCRLGYVRDMLLTVKNYRMKFLFSKQSKTPAEDDNKELSFFTADADILESSYYNNKAQLPQNIAMFIFALASMLWISWVVTLVALAVSMLPMLVSNFFGKGLASRKKAYSDATADYVDNARECIEGKKDIIAYSKQSNFMAKHGRANEKAEDARFKSSFFQAVAIAVPNNLGFMVQIVILGLSSYLVITGSLTFGYMIAIIQLINYLLNPIGSIVDAVNGIRSAKPILEKASEQAEEEPEKAPITAFNTAIEIKNLGLRYTEDAYVVSGLNLSFKKGRKYAVLAPSGYGKSSIAKALAMEFANFDGAINIDGKDIRGLNRNDYSKMLRFVRQDPYLFSDTALNNIAFFDSIIDKNELSRVMELTRIDKFLPDDEALMRPITNNSGLSGGQKQRIVLARALLHKPEILVLDEITSGVDLKTACDVLSDIFEDKKLTCITITHESNDDFLSLFDEVIYLEQELKAKIA